MKRPTQLNEIATRLGVSASTVSRALRHPELVREETRVEIIKAANMAGYQTPPALSTRPRTGCIGMLVPDLENPFFTTLARAAMNEGRRHGYSLIIADSNEDPLGESEITALTGKRVDGLILVSSRLRDDDLLKTAQDMPLLLVNRELVDVPSLLIDNEPGMGQAVEHLAALGHQSVAYVEGPPTSWSNRQRRQSFEAITRMSGVEGVLLGPYPPRFDGGIQAADVAVARGVSAVIAYNDVMAFGIMSRLSGRGIAVPGEMSVVGFDDVPSASIWSPPLTTISASTTSIGKSAVSNLIRLIDGKPVYPEDRLRLPSHLVVRGSTATRS